MNVNAGGLTFPDATSQYTAAVNADWNAVGGLAEILNKPPIPVNLDDLGDVNAPTPGNGQVLAFNSISGDWEAVTPTTGSGTVTSVGLTMPSAFNVSGSPVTTAGTLAVTGAGLATQYVRGDGQLANFPTTSGGGSSVSYYLNGSINQGTIGGSIYYQMSKTAVFGAGTDFTRTNAQGNGLIAQFITDVNDPNVLLIPGGNFNLEFYFNASSPGGTPSFYVELYKYDGAAFTLLATDVATPEGITQGTVIDAYFTALAVPPTVMTLSDRLALRVFVTTSGRTIKLHTENGHLCQVITTLSTGVNAINGLTAQVQNLATGTAGTDFGISSSGSTHTFNLPTASASNRGALSSADWSTFNSKQNSIGLTTVGTALATLPDPSAVRYLRINAGNTVSALTLSELKTDLGLGTIAIKSSNQSSAITTYADITDLSFPVVNGKKYRFKIVALYDATNTATGSRWSINSAVTFSNLLYYVEWSLTAGGASTRKGYTTYDEETTANATSAFTTGNVAVIEGIILPTSTGTVNARFACELTITSITCKAGSYVEWEEVL